MAKCVALLCVLPVNWMDENGHAPLMKVLNYRYCTYFNTSLCIQNQTKNNVVTLYSFPFFLQKGPFHGVKC